MKEILLTQHILESRFIEAIDTINSLFSNRIIEYIYTDHFYKPEGIYKSCCTPQKYIDIEWPHMKTFLSLNQKKEDISIAMVLPLNGVQNVRELLVKYDNNQLTIDYLYNAKLNIFLRSFAMTFYD